MGQGGASGLRSIQESKVSQESERVSWAWVYPLLQPHYVTRALGSHSENGVQLHREGSVLSGSEALVTRSEIRSVRMGQAGEVFC